MSDFLANDQLHRDIASLRQSLHILDNLIDRLDHELGRGVSLEDLAPTIMEIRFLADGARALAERAIRHL